MRNDTLEDSFFGAILSVFLGWVLLFESKIFDVWKNTLIILIIAIAVLILKKGFTKRYFHIFSIMGSYCGIVAIRGGPLFDGVEGKSFISLVFSTAVPQHQYDIFWILIVLWIIVGELGKKI